MCQDLEINYILDTFEMAPVLCLIENVVIEKALELFKFGEGDGIFAPGGL